MYDIEVANPKHNFVLPNGIITSNNHSVCYSYVAYACSFLKHHFPVEWWAAVLTNADKNEIAEKFWSYSKQWIDLPDIRYSGSQWEIINGRIRAPLGLIQGIGPAAHKELCEGRPFTGIQQLTDYIIKVKQSKSKLNEETGKVKAGLSALNKGVISKLVAAGVMDSMFTGENLTIYDKLLAYEEAYANSMTAVQDPKKKPKKPKKPDEKFLKFNALSLFQYKKSILPVYHEDLLPIFCQAQIHGIVKELNKGYKYVPSDPVVLGDLLNQKGGDKAIEHLPLVNGAQLKYLNEGIEIYDGQLVACAAAGFIVSERPFSYKKEGKAKHAVEVVFDVDGEQFKVVKWPPRKVGNKAIIPSNLTGALAILLVSRYRTDRPFTLDAIQVVVPPMSEEKEESSET
jgi:hypothetical protein